ncbi:MAG: insulinase family protein [Gallionellaceae bacterium]|jgi:zinc protease|nr:insulinase family protein [Gallionellaceae bacterium]
MFAKFFFISSNHTKPLPPSGGGVGERGLGEISSPSPIKGEGAARWKFAGREFFALLALLLSAPAFATPAIQHWQAPSGAEVYFVEDHGLPMLDVSVDFYAGAAFEPATQSGVAMLTNGMLNLGAGGLSEDDISRKLADIGAQPGSHFDNDRAGLTMRTLSSETERAQALDVLALMLQSPQFPDAVLAREKARQIALLKESETQPDYIAEKAYGKAVFGDHPYGRSLEAADLEKIQRADLAAFYKAHYVAKGAIVAIMGDIDRAGAEAIAQKLTAQLPAGVAPTEAPPVNTQIAASEQRIAHPAQQSHILLGAPGMARDDPDYVPLYVGNYILGGGGFVSRLMNEVRENRGLAYSVYSYFMPMQQPGGFQIGLQTRKDQADDALALVRDTLRQFIAKGPTAGELQAAKDNIIGGFPLRIDSNKEIHEYLGIIGFYKLPLTYLDDFTAKVDKVTVAQIHEAFRRHIDPDAMATVMVGAPEAKAAK